MMEHPHTPVCSWTHPLQLSIKERNILLVFLIHCFNSLVSRTHCMRTSIHIHMKVDCYFASCTDQHQHQVA